MFWFFRGLDYVDVDDGMSGEGKLCYGKKYPDCLRSVYISFVTTCMAMVVDSDACGVECVDDIGGPERCTRWELGTDALKA